MGPRRLAAPLAEMHRRVVRMACEKTRERKGRVVTRALGEAPVLHPFYRFARHLIRECARFTGRLVRAVELEHDLVLGCRPEKRPVLIDDLFRFVIEEVDLRAYNADAVQTLEELRAGVIRFEIPAVLPKPDADIELFRIIGKLTHLVFGPSAPEAFHDVVFETQLTGKPGKFFHAR